MFYILTGGSIHKHQFKYLSDEKSKRLDPTIVPYRESLKEAGQENDSGVNENITYAIEVMTHNPLSLRPNDLASKALEHFHQKKIHHLPITKKNKLVGFISDRDLLGFEKLGIQSEVKIDHFMSKTVLAAHEETPLEDIIKVMYNELIHGMPIIDKNYDLAGIITYSDVFGYILEMVKRGKISI